MKRVLKWIGLILLGIVVLLMLAGATLYGLSGRKLARKQFIPEASFVPSGVAEITRLKAEDGGPMEIGGATLAGAAMRAGLVDEYLLVTAPVLVGGGTPFFTTLDSWVNLNLLETRTFPDGVILTRYETKR